ncbi:VOC family protein [Erwinia mallotivora]|uniref:VOC family protein n=1 Tax=Erwinia mallotivora TaxID=69222 RepID=UPI0021C1528E|nr:VOC family protein [Erwinia mallotivora]
MHITHVALWTSNMERQVRFWTTFFSASCGEKYVSSNNPGFESYFITLEQGATIELMTKPGLVQSDEGNNRSGWVHIALAVGSEDNVNALAEQANRQGILAGKPRWTGDGYYEAVINDPDGNLIEIVAG